MRNTCHNSDLETLYKSKHKRFNRDIQEKKKNIKCEENKTFLQEYMTTGHIWAREGHRLHESVKRAVIKVSRHKVLIRNHIPHKES